MKPIIKGMSGKEVVSSIVLLIASGICWCVIMAMNLVNPPVKTS